MAFIGVRISWLMLARNSLLAALAASAAARARRASSTAASMRKVRPLAIKSEAASSETATSPATAKSSPCPADAAAWDITGSTRSCQARPAKSIGSVRPPGVLWPSSQASGPASRSAGAGGVVSTMQTRTVAGRRFRVRSSMRSSRTVASTTPKASRRRSASVAGSPAYTA